MALILGHTKAALKMITDELKAFAFIFNIVAQATMVVYLTYNLIASTGLWYVNAALLVLSLFSLTLTIIARFNEVKKKTQKDIKNIIRWAKRILKLLPIGIALYSLFLAPYHLTPLALISPIVITVTWLLEILINFLYKLIISRKDLFFAGIEIDFGDKMFVGKYASQLTGNSLANVPQEKLQLMQKIAEEEEKAWKEKNQTAKTEKKEKRRSKLKNLFSKSSTKK